MKNKILSMILLAVLVACSTATQPLILQAHSQNTAAQSPDLLLDIINQHSEQKQKPFFNQAVPSVAQTGYLANPNVQAFIRYQNQRNYLDINYLNQFFAQVGYRGNLINAMNRPATSRPWYEFQKNNSGAAKIQAGRKFYQENQAVFDQAAVRYGVPAEILVAIVAIETNFGKNSGSVRVADSLATLAFDYPRRGAFFQEELGEFLKLAQEENQNPFNFKGSFAGAMGMPQFMPSSFRRWAVDFDGDGRRNIWTSVPDVAASVANYIKQHGWQTNGRMIIPVLLSQETPQILSILNEKTNLNHTVRELRQLGIIPSEAVNDNEHAILYRLEVAPNRYQYFIGLNNFYTIWNYNHSKMYVTAVRDIANGIRDGNL